MDKERIAFPETGQERRIAAVDYRDQAAAEIGCLENLFRTYVRRGVGGGSKAKGQGSEEEGEGMLFHLGAEAVAAEERNCNRNRNGRQTFGLANPKLGSFGFSGPVSSGQAERSLFLD